MKCYNTECDNYSTLTKSRCRDGLTVRTCIYHKPKPEEPGTEYELTEKYKDGFSLVDIYSKLDGVCANNNFLTLYGEFSSVCFDIKKIVKLHWWMEFKTIQKNIPWLIEKGFIREKAERWVNVYLGRKEGGIIRSGDACFDTEEKAKLGVWDNNNYITTIKLP